MKTQTQAREDWLNKCSNLYKAAQALLASYEALTQEDSDSTSEEFPFYNDYESVVYAINGWYHTTQENWSK